MPESREQRIRRIASRVRRQHLKCLREEYSGGDKELKPTRTTFMSCGDASELLSKTLAENGIEHRLVRGCWHGPVDDTFMELFGDYEDLESGCQEGVGHVWIEIPDIGILDIAADQFSNAVDSIVFPGDPEWYSPHEMSKTHDRFFWLPYKYGRPYRVREHWRRHAPIGGEDYS